MTRILVRITNVFFLSLCFWSAGAAAAGDEKEQAFQFAFTIESELVSKLSGNLTGNTELRYTWQRRGRERSLSFDSVQLKVKKDGSVFMDSVMNHSRFTSKGEGKPLDISHKDAPDHLKKRMDEMFGSPVCKLLVDANGKQVKRTIVDTPGARQLADGGMVTNALFFHPPRPGDKDEWLVDAEITIAGNATAKGKLRYQKKAAVNGKQECHVHGALTNDEIKGPKKFATRNVRYVFDGTHSYDPALQEWVAGKLTAAVSFDIVDGDKVMDTTKGTMTLTVKLLAKEK